MSTNSVKPTNDIQTRLSKIIAFSLSIFTFVAFLSGTIIYSKQLFEDNLMEGVQLVKTLSDESRFSLILNAPENVEKILRSIKHIPDITNVEIYHANGELFIENGHKTKIKNIDFEYKQNEPAYQLTIPNLVIFSPIYSTPYFTTDKTELSDALGTNTQSKELLGYAVIRYDNKPFFKSTGLFALVLISSLLLASIVLWIYFRRVMRQITIPLKQLSSQMANPVRLTHVSLENSATEEMIEINQAYNDMLDILHKRDNQLEVYTNKLNDLLDNRTQALESADNNALNVLSNVSHNIKTPLQAILSRATFIRDNDKTLSEPGSKNNAEAIIESTHSILQFVTQLVTMNALKSGKFEPILKSISIKELLNKAVEMHKPIADRRNNKLCLEIDDTVDAIISDDNIIYQILINLIGNSAKYSENNDIIVSAKSSPPYVLISVSDNGPGIPDDIKQTIFHSFQRFPLSEDKRENGFGMGLYITNQLAALLSGKIEMCSEVGIGSTFTLKIPMKSAASIEANVINFKTPQTNSISSDSLNILIAEDSSELREIYQKILFAPNHKIKVARNGGEALFQIINNQFDVVVLDENMPILNGSDVIAIAKRYFSNLNIHYVLISAEETIRHIDISSHITFLKKPIENDELFRVVYGQRAIKQNTIESSNIDQIKSKRIIAKSTSVKLLNLLGESEAIDFIDTFQDKTQLILKKMDATSDRDLLVKSLHNLGGTASTVGANRFAFAVKNYEKLIREGSNIDINEMSVQLIQELHFAHNSLKKIFVQNMKTHESVN